MISSELLIAPSILSADLAYLAQEVKAVEQAGADWLHLDIMDGRFVPNITFGMPLVRSLRLITPLPLDVHLMIEEPSKYIEAFAKAGANTITVHVEACPHLDRTLQQIKDHGCRAGVALNPSTPPESIRYVMHRLDQILVMTVNPGFGGQSMIFEALEKIPLLLSWAEEKGKSIDIEVDGGVNKETATAVHQAGANILVAGSAVFSAPSTEYANRIEGIKNATKNK